MQAQNTFFLNPLSLATLNSVSCISCHTLDTPSAHTACLLGKVFQTLIICTVFLQGKNSPKEKNFFENLTFSLLSPYLMGYDLANQLTQLKAA